MRDIRTQSASVIQRRGEERSSVAAPSGVGTYRAFEDYAAQDGLRHDERESVEPPVPLDDEAVALRREVRLAQVFLGEARRVGAASGGNHSGVAIEVAPTKQPYRHISSGTGLTSSHWKRGHADSTRASIDREIHGPNLYVSLTEACETRNIPPSSP